MVMWSSCSGPFLYEGQRMHVHGDRVHVGLSYVCVLV